jgi:hypothetical protein
MTDKDNNGALFRNDKKNDRQPDYGGKCTVGGVRYKISAWVKKPDGKEPFMSIAFTPEDEQKSQLPGKGDGKPQVDSGDFPF